MNKLTKSLLVTCAIFAFGNAHADQSAAVQADFTNVANIETVKEVQPKYPALAVRSGVEGYVILSYDLDANGKPKDIEIMEEHPKRVFSHAAIRALKASRFSVVDAEGVSYSVNGLARRYDFQFPADFNPRTARRR